MTLCELYENISKVKNTLKECYINVKLNIYLLNDIDDIDDSISLEELSKIFAKRIDKKKEDVIHDFNRVQLIPSASDGICGISLFKYCDPDGLGTIFIYLQVKSSLK